MPRMKPILLSEQMNLSLAKKVEALSGTSVRRCFQCGKCSAGCPMASYMEHSPNRVLRLLQLGQGERLLSSRSIWYCASCETCTTRCPNQVDLARVMDALRNLAWKSGHLSAGNNVQLVDRLFLDNIRNYGRQFEMKLGAFFNLKSGQFLKDFLLAPKLLSRGKLKMSHKKNRNLAEIQAIFGRIEEMRKKGEAP